ncbi:MAG TPA: MFS transporter [Streptosporangiaceae bacterium]|nr:MFS transporter [Streptosporangiaceae bacterium]
MRFIKKKSPNATASTIPPLRKNRDFMLLWTGAGYAALGRQIGFIAFPLLMIYQLGSAEDAGLVSFAALVPMLVIELPAGVLVDRWDRRRMMIICDIAGLAAMGSVGLALFLGHVWLLHVMAAAFIEASAGIVYQLCEESAVRNVVHSTHVSQAISQNEARSRAANLLGQPAGSALFALTRWLPFGVASLGHVAALINLMLIKVNFQTERTRAPRKVRVEIAEGFAWLWGQKFVRSAIAVVAGSNLLFQIMTLSLYVIIRNHGGSPATIGAISVVMGVGGVLGALSGSKWLKWLSISTLVIGALGLWTILTTAMAFTASPWLLGALFGGTTFVGAALNVSAGTIMNRVTPDEIRGRAMSVAFLFAFGANSVGALIGGFALKQFSTSHVVLGVGTVMLALTIIAAVSPAIRRPDLPPEGEEAPVSGAPPAGQSTEPPYENGTEPTIGVAADPTAIPHDDELLVDD